MKDYIIIIAIVCLSIGAVLGAYVALFASLAMYVGQINGAN